MTERAELKRLAEAFPSDLDWDSNTEPFFNGPSGESLGGGADGTYTVYGKPFRLEGEDYDYDGPTYVERCGVDFAKFIVSARGGVLALIAENEQLKHDVAAGSAREWDLRSQVRSAKESRARIVQSNKAAREKRDQLKAEVEVLRKKVCRARVVAIPSKDDPKYWESFPELEGGPDFNGQRYVSDLLAALKADGITVSEVIP